MRKNIFNIFALVFFSNSLAFAETLKQELFRETSAGHQSFNYSEARKKLFNDIYLQKDTDGYYYQDVYCQDKIYAFDGEDPAGRLPDAKLVNTEHTWPQSKFSSAFSRTIQKSDLHHLFPTHSKINSERGNFPFGEANEDRDLFCDDSQSGGPESGGSGTYFEPPDNHKGNVARAMFYFSVRYQIAIDPNQEKYLRLWHKEDPVDQMEKSRHEKIFQLQHNRNPFIDRPQLVSEIQDF